MAIRENCPAWELQVGQLCWFINGTICGGKEKKDWAEKITICRKYNVFKSKQVKCCGQAVDLGHSAQ